MHHVYEIFVTNKNHPILNENEVVYVGATQHPFKRFDDHLCGRGCELVWRMRRWGNVRFAIRVVSDHSTHKKALAEEKRLISVYDAPFNYQHGTYVGAERRSVCYQWVREEERAEQRANPPAPFTDLPMGVIPDAMGVAEMLAW